MLLSKKEMNVNTSFLIIGSPALRDPIIVWSGKQLGPLAKLITSGKDEVSCEKFVSLKSYFEMNNNP